MSKPELVVQVCLTPIERISAEGRTVPVSVTADTRSAPAHPPKPPTPTVASLGPPAPVAALAAPLPLHLPAAKTPPPAGRPVPEPTRPVRKGPGLLRRNLPLVVILAILAAINIAGLTYYVSAIGERMRSPLHVWLKPSGYVGQSAGLIAFGLFLFLYLYPLRKRFRFLAFTGRLNRWLDVHIVAGLAVPLFGAVHAAWRFQGLIGWGYFSMVMVSLSGIVGKYLYTHIPRSKNGLALTLDQIDAKRDDLLERIASMTGIAKDQIATALATRDARAARSGIWAALSALLSNDFTRWRMMRRLRRKLREHNATTRALDKKALREVVRLARREIAMTQQLRMLEATQRLFRFWHVFHRPFSITAFVAVTIHVVLVISLGVTWIW